MRYASVCTSLGVGVGVGVGLPARKQASKQAGKQAGKHARKQGGGQLVDRYSVPLNMLGARDCSATSETCKAWSSLEQLGAVQSSTRFKMAG
jgi:AICAR transformylase/IMP cyclohydrolase PurH